MELMSCTRIGTSETELSRVSDKKTLHFKRRMYVTEYTCSPRVCHESTLEKESRAPSPSNLTSGDTVPSTPEQHLSGPQRGSGHLEKSVLRLRETESIPLT